MVEEKNGLHLESEEEEGRAGKTINNSWLSDHYD